MAAIVESPTKRTLGFTRGTVVVVVVEVSIVVSTTVDEVVVVVDSSVFAPGSAPETAGPMLMANAALNMPAMNRVVNLFITLITRTIWNSPDILLQPETILIGSKHYKTAPNANIEKIRDS
jgi:hypothetical protein